MKISSFHLWLLASTDFPSQRHRFHKGVQSGDVSHLSDKDVLSLSTWLDDTWEDGHVVTVVMQGF